MNHFKHWIRGPDFTDFRKKPSEHSYPTVYEIVLLNVDNKDKQHKIETAN